MINGKMEYGKKDKNGINQLKKRRKTLLELFSHKDWVLSIRRYCFENILQCNPN